MTFEEAFQNYVHGLISQIHAYADDLCVQAMMLQDYDMLDRLQVVYDQRYQGDRYGLLTHVSIQSATPHLCT